MQLTGPNRRRRRAHFDFETDPLARGDLVAFIVAISCRVRGSRRRARAVLRREKERLLCAVGIEPLLLRSRIGVESITVKPSAVTSIDCFILATRMEWAHPSLERQCDACETREEDLGDFRNGSLVCDVAPLRAFSLSRAQSVSQQRPIYHSG